MPEERIKVLVSPKDQILKTKGASETDIQTVSMPIWQQVLVRGARSSLDAFLATVGTVQAINIYDGTAMQPIKMALITAGIAFISSAVRNLTEILSRLDETKPGMRA
jgi:hypothetical protein